MNVTVKKLTNEESIIEVQTRSGMQTITIMKTKYGHSYEDHAEWDISDDDYYALEELIEGVIKQMNGKSTLNITYALDHEEE